MSPIKLLLSDVDGTLVTSDKALAASTIDAVRRLRENGVEFATTSGRAPRGMAMLVDPLQITTPLAACNGGCVVTPELEDLVVQALEPSDVQTSLDLMGTRGLSPWIFCGSDWFVLDRHGPHVDREIIASKYEPMVVESLNSYLNGVTKIVGVSDDSTVISEGTRAITDAIGTRATVSTSQAYFIDVTHIDANKGWVLRYMARTLGIDPTEIATIGDGQNDIAMFELSGLSIAVDGHNEEARKAADYVTANNDQDGFARAVTDFVLPHNI